jgi:hypothetical protein
VSNEFSETVEHSELTEISSDGSGQTKIYKHVEDSRDGFDAIYRGNVNKSTV